MTFPWAIACWGHSACNGRRMPLFGLRVTINIMAMAQNCRVSAVSHQPKHLTISWAVNGCKLPSSSLNFCGPAHQASSSLCNRIFSSRKSLLSRGAPMMADQKGHFWRPFERRRSCTATIIHNCSWNLCIYICCVFYTWIDNLKCIAASSCKYTELCILVGGFNPSEKY